MIRQKRRAKNHSPAKMFWSKVYDWMFPLMTPEQFNKCLHGRYFLGIAERYPKDTGELERLKKMLEEYEKRINAKDKPSNQ